MIGLTFLAIACNWFYGLPVNSHDHSNDKPCNMSKSNGMNPGFLGTENIDFGTGVCEGRSVRASSSAPVDDDSGNAKPKKAKGKQKKRYCGMRSGFLAPRK